MRRILLLSTSTVHGGGYMQYAVPYLQDLLGARRAILFVPFARPSGISHDEYTATFARRFEPLGYEIRGIHRCEDAAAAVREAEAVFIGGGNTFVLLRELYGADLIRPLRERVASGMPYMGSSAGSNVAGLSIGTTNDMPIAYPPTLEALALVPFNINPHYLDPDPDSTHMGETRETRINEFHVFNPHPVVALREGAMLRARGDRLELLGERGGRLFRRGRPVQEIAADTRLDDLLSTT